jgi:hypothetical protein
MRIANTRCPYCFGRMQVSSLACERCGTEVRGEFALGSLLSLTAEQQSFVVRFVTASGSLKEMAEVLGVSYPTVRARLDRIIEVLRTEQTAGEARRGAILDAIEEKRLTPQEATDLMSERDEGAQ